MENNRFTIFYDVADFISARNFYHDVLQLKIRHEYDDAGHKCGAIFAVNEHVDLEIMGPGSGNQQQRPAPENVRLKFSVANVDAFYERLQQSNAEIIEPIADKTWGERTFAVRAPDGLLIYVSMDIASK